MPFIKLLAWFKKNQNNGRNEGKFVKGSNHIMLDSYILTLDNSGCLKVLLGDKLIDEKRYEILPGYSCSLQIISQNNRVFLCSGGSYFQIYTLDKHGKLKSCYKLYKSCQIVAGMLLRNESGMSKFYNGINNRLLFTIPMVCAAAGNCVLRYDLGRMLIEEYNFQGLVSSYNVDHLFQGVLMPALTLTTSTPTTSTSCQTSSLALSDSTSISGAMSDLIFSGGHDKYFYIIRRFYFKDYCYNLEDIKHRIDLILSKSDDSEKSKTLFQVCDLSKGNDNYLIKIIEVTKRQLVNQYLFLDHPTITKFNYDISFGQDAKIMTSAESEPKTNMLYHFAENGTIQPGRYKAQQTIIFKPDKKIISLISKELFNILTKFPLTMIELLLDYLF